MQLMRIKTITNISQETVINFKMFFHGILFKKLFLFFIIFKNLIYRRYFFLLKILLKYSHYFLFEINLFEKEEKNEHARLT